MAAENGRLRWQWFFEWVIVPVTGLILSVYGAVTGSITAVWIPVVAGLIAFPFARYVDKLRR